MNGKHKWRLAWLLLVAACASEQEPLGVLGPQQPTECPKPTVVYLNRHAGVFRHGFVSDSVDNLLVANTPGPTTLLPWVGEDDHWDAIVDCLEGQVADFNIRVTTNDPGSIEHLEIVFSGDPDVRILGINSSPTQSESLVAGVFTCPMNPRALGVVFSAEGCFHPSGYDLAACQEAGRLLGRWSGLQVLSLSVSSSVRDIMVNQSCGPGYGSTLTTCLPIRSSCSVCDLDKKEQTPVQSSYDYMLHSFGPYCDG